MNQQSTKIKPRVLTEAGPQPLYDIQAEEHRLREKLSTQGVELVRKKTGKSKSGKKAGPVMIDMPALATRYAARQVNRAVDAMHTNDVQALAEVLEDHGFAKEHEKAAAILEDFATLSLERNTVVDLPGLKEAEPAASAEGARQHIGTH